VFGSGATSETSSSNTLADEFDSEAYLAANPDVAAAVLNGEFANAYMHFVLFGQFEARPGTALDNGTVLTGQFATRNTPDENIVKPVSPVPVDTNGGETPPPPPPPAPAQTFTLTTAADTFTGGTGADRFVAESAGVLQSSDTLTGGAGNDVLTIALGAIGSTGHGVAPVIRGIETIENRNGDSEATPFGLQNTDGVALLISEVTSGEYIYENAELSTVFAARNIANANIVIRYKDTSGAGDIAKLRVQEADQALFKLYPYFPTGETIEPQGVEQVAIEAVASTTNDKVYKINVRSETATKLILTGGGNVSINDDGGSSLKAFAIFDGSSATGKIRFDFSDSSYSAPLQITGGAGDDMLVANGMADIVRGGAGNDSINGRGGDDTLYGDAGNDTLYGEDGDDILYGGAGDDTLFGDTGADKLHGGDGDDVLTGGSGQTEMTGDAGRDEFRFARDDTQNTIQDFSVGTDIIALANQSMNGLRFANSTDSGTNSSDLSADDFVSVDTLYRVAASDNQKLVVVRNATSLEEIQSSDSEGQFAEYFFVVFNTDAGKAQLWYDPNASESGNSRLVADIEGLTTVESVGALTAANFGVFGASKLLELELA